MFSFHMLTMTWVTDILFERLNLVSTIFYQTFTLSPMLALQKLQKNLWDLEEQRNEKGGFIVIIWGEGASHKGTKWGMGGK